MHSDSHWRFPVMTEAVKLTEVHLKIVVRKDWRDVTGEASLMEMFDLATSTRKITEWVRSMQKPGKLAPVPRFSYCPGHGGQADAIVFAPLNKLAMSLAGPASRMSTTICQIHQVGTLRRDKRPGPLFTSRATSHIGFRDIVHQLTQKAL